MCVCVWKELVWKRLRLVLFLLSVNVIVHIRKKLMILLPHLSINSFFCSFSFLFLVLATKKNVKIWISSLLIYCYYVLFRTKIFSILHDNRFDPLYFNPISLLSSVQMYRCIYFYVIKLNLTKNKSFGWTNIGQSTHIYKESIRLSIIEIFTCVWNSTVITLFNLFICKVWY